MSSHAPLAAALAIASLLAAPLDLAPARAAEPSKLPNILFILTDDLGHGDVRCYNPHSKIPTPNLDKLAAQGIRFTDAHSPATVCTPTRYALLTGRLCFRTGYRGVFTGAGGPCLIEPGRPNLGSVLQSRGYRTAMFGKWHVGLTFLDSDGNPIHKGGIDDVKRVDFNRPIPDAPIRRGFDRFFGTACCPTSDWLYAYIDGDRVPVPPTQVIDKTTLPRNPYTRDCRPGLIAPAYKLEETDLVFLDKARSFMRDHVKEHPDRPFLVVHSMTAVHFASLPAPQFVGKSGFGPHGDFIHQMDWVVGQIMATLDELGVADNTLVMFGSDNGPEVAAVVNMRADHAHDGAYPWRGMKRDNWEGGHRTPFIARWPGRIRPGSTSDQLLSLTDVLATCAAIAGADLPDDAAEDSFNMLSVLLGEQGDEPVRPYLIAHTISNALSIRRGPWKLLDHRGSGGNNYEKSDDLRPFALPDNDPAATAQLYNLADDPGETTNLYSTHPGIAAELKRLLDESVKSGRSRPAK